VSDRAIVLDDVIDGEEFICSSMLCEAIEGLELHESMREAVKTSTLILFHFIVLLPKSAVLDERE